MRRVVVTGMGLATPVGLDVESSWESLREGRGGGGPGTLFDAGAFATRIVAELKGFDLARDLGEDADRWEAHGRNTKIALAVAAPGRASADAAPTLTASASTATNGATVTFSYSTPAGTLSSTNWIGITNYGLSSGIYDCCENTHRAITAITDGATSLMSFLYGMHASGAWVDERASNMLDDVG